ncbi:hypothetical protein MUN88_15155 [Gracilibacillus caseinilyticus]|uniref:Uncharacterized protein n=1 Tax=Gracilibacillus caseinilyticus TaxID=2932256 RepID=A0ABY4EU53_9BACI|nr:hypothetical protein [Gracilibacillus caseinilyticus]UOQ47397.1 hypothetical protein MUN88_15155 [Gracilibacillus caseinilyticus]
MSKVKYFFYLLLLSICFSIGMYLGIDRSGETATAEGSKAEQASEEVSTSQFDQMNRAAIMEEVEKNGVTENELEPAFIHSVANKGETVVKHFFNQIVHATYAIVDGLFS